MNYNGDLTDGAQTTGLVIVTDSAHVYRPDTHEFTPEAGVLTLVDGVGTLTLSLPVIGRLTLSITDPNGINQYNADISSTCVVTFEEAEEVEQREVKPGPKQGLVDFDLPLIPLSTIFNVLSLAGKNDFLLDLVYGLWGFFQHLVTIIFDALDLSDVGRDGITVLSSPNGLFSSLRRTKRQLTASHIDALGAIPSLSVKFSVSATDTSANAVKDRLYDLLRVRADGSTQLLRLIATTEGLPDQMKKVSFGPMVLDDFSVRMPAGFVGCVPEFSAFTECSAVCDDGFAVRTRTSECPLHVEVEYCPVPACGNCDVDNGGCGPRADCTIDPEGTHQAICTCDNERYLGDGLDCRDPTEAESEPLWLKLHFQTSLLNVAKTRAHEVFVVDHLVSSLAEKLQIDPVRFQFTAVHSTRPNEFAFSSFIVPFNPSGVLSMLASDIHAKFHAGDDFVSSLNSTFEGTALVPSYAIASLSSVSERSTTTTITSTITTITTTRSSTTSISSSVTETEIDVTTIVPTTAQQTTAAKADVEEPTIPGVAIGGGSEEAPPTIVVGLANGTIFGPNGTVGSNGSAAGDGGPSVAEKNAAASIGSGLSGWSRANTITLLVSRRTRRTVETAYIAGGWHTKSQIGLGVYRV